jgi:carboxylesterase
MPDATAPFRLNPSSPTGRAVLLLHGFTGSPWELRLMGDSLAARGFHVVAPRLPGHGTEPEAMLFVTWRDWVAGAEAAFRALSLEFEHVSIAGLSMGGLLGLILAAREAERVRRLVVMAPVLQLRAGPGRWLHRFRHTPLAHAVPTWFKKAPPDLEDEVMRAQAPSPERFPVARVLDLFSLQDLAKRAISSVRCPTLIFAATNDHVVDPGALDDLHAALPSSRLVRLQRGYHVIPRDLERARVISETAEFLDAP